LVGRGNMSIRELVNDEATHFPHHNERFNIDEKSLLISTELYVEYALKYLNGEV